MWIDPERFRVDIGLYVDHRAWSQYNHRVPGKRAYNHVRVAIVVNIGRAGRQWRAESPESADAGEIPGADALRVGRENPTRRAAEYVDGPAVFVRCPDSQI